MCGRHLVPLTLLWLLVLGVPVWSTEGAPVAAPAIAPGGASGSSGAVAAPGAQRQRDVQKIRPSRDGERVSSGLEVTIDQVSPASLIPGEPVQVSGTVTNMDPQRWIDLQAYLVVDKVTISSPEQLDILLESPADAYSGERICCAPRTYDDSITALAPGQSTDYELDVAFPRLNLDESPPGVYTVSVQVLGERVDQGRIDGYDGRARILMPYLSDAQDATGVAVVIPLHHSLSWLPDGTIEDVDELVASVSPGGLLHNRLDLVAASVDGQATLLVDPALLDALGAVADDDFGPPVPGGGGPGEDDETEAQLAAAAFLDRLELAAARTSVLVEPYGRADLTALAQHPRFRLGRTVAEVGTRALEAASVAGSPVYRPDGELDPAALAAVAGSRLVLVDSDQVTGWSTIDAPSARLVADGPSARVVVADTSLRTGGLAPGPADSALDLRQRLLAEAAVLSLSEGAAGLVFVPDDDWDPGQRPVSDELFDQLATPWVVPITLGDLPGVGPAAPVRAADSLVLQPLPLPTSVLSAAAALSRHASTLEAVAPDVALPYYQRTAVLALSSTLRATPEEAKQLAAENLATIDKQLDRISVEGPQAVTLSSSSGPFPITFTNRLDRPVTVGAAIYDEDDLLIVEGIEPRVIGPGSQVTVTVDVVAPDVGVTTVYARLTTKGGRRFGEPVTFPLRSSAVGAIIWYAMGAVAIFVLLLVIRRISRRLRTKAPQPERSS